MEPIEIFWRTISNYNASTWPFQSLLVLAGIVLTVKLLHRPSAKAKMAMKVFLIVLHLWIAVAYYYVFCAERSYHLILALFWGMMAVVWIWDAAKGYTTFERSYKYDYLAYFMLAMPFIYPVFSLLRGLSFPGITSPVMPCSVAVFTIGLLLLFSKKVNILSVLFLSHWALVGIFKTSFYDIPEDSLLSVASMPALYLFFKEYYTRELERSRKPDAKYIRFLVWVLCILIVVAIAISLWTNFFR